MSQLWLYEYMFQIWRIDPYALCKRTFNHIWNMYSYSLFREVCPLKQIYGKVIKIKGKCQKMKGEYKKCAFPPGKNSSIYWSTKWWITVFEKLLYIKENMMKNRDKIFYDIETFCIIVNLTNFKWFFRGGNAKITSFRPIKSYLLTFWKTIYFHWLTFTPFIFTL